MATINFYDDFYNLIAVRVSGKYDIRLSKKMRYDFRSQGNIHLLFICEHGHYFHKSFDGHKGNVFVDENTIMDELCNFLNNKRIDEEDIYWGLNYKLLAHIEEFFNKSEEGEL